MNCKRTRQAIKSLIYGEKADVACIQEHLAKCPRCAEQYRPFLMMAESFEGMPSPQLDDGAWREFSAKLRSRIEREHPAPIGSWRSFLLWLGQWKLVRFRKAVAASLAAMVVVLGLLKFAPDFRPRQVNPTETALVPADVPDPTPDMPLPPSAEEAISILGNVGFVTGVFSGNIQPGYFIGGYELTADDIAEALDYLLS